MNNKSLVFLYKKLYNNGEFIEMIVNPNEIKTISKYYKNNFEKYKNFELFIESMGHLGNLLKQSKSAYCEVKKQFIKHKGLQPAILSECFIFQTIANLLDLKKFSDVDDINENIPRSLSLHLMHFSGETGIAYPRYIYYNEKANIALLQYGDSSSIDAIFLKDRKAVRIEFKEEKSKLSEIDISGYDETGHLCIDDNFKRKYEEYIPLIDEFNNQTTIFQHIGHNFKVANYLKKDEVATIIEKTFKIKKIDLFLLQQENCIYPILAKNLFLNIDISGSEIRTAGRNYKKIFTPTYAKNIIQEKGGRIKENGFVEMPFQEDSSTIGRTLTKVTRYKINSLLYLKYEEIERKDDTIFFKLKNLRQLKPTIAIHIQAMISKQLLKEAYFEIKKS